MKEREEVLGKTVVRFKRQYKATRIEEKELHHPVHQPYKREPKNWLRHSVMIDGLGDEEEFEPE